MYLKQLNIEEIRKIQMDILTKVDKFCKDNNLRYSLAYGTLIGAIRHEGYIPWDDDIDIVMPRPDYEKFIHNFNGTIENIKVYATELDPKFICTYAKIADERTLVVENINLQNKVGVNIDLFAIDGIHIDDMNIIKKQRFYKNLQDVKTIKLSSSRSFLKNAILALGKASLFCFSNERINSILLKKAKEYAFRNNKYSFDEEKHCCNLAPGFIEDEILPIEYFEKYSEYTFENKKFMVTKFYHEWLTSIYGDYMQLPPEEKQVSHHDFKAYLK